MLSHYFKIAWRNIMKYKLQNAISIASIAVGIVVLAAVQAFLENVKEPNICDEPYFDRTFKVTLFSQDPCFKPQDLEGMETLDGKVYIDYQSRHSTRSSLITFNGKAYKSDENFAYRDPDILNLFDIRSVVTGNRIGHIRDNEAILSQQYAKKIFGDDNPIGAVIENDGREYVVTDVCENRGFCTQIPTISPIMLSCNNLQHTDYNDSIVSSVVLLMKEGADYEAFAREIASRLNKPREEVWVDQICNNGQDTFYRLHILLRLLGYMILLASAIGFLRMQIQLFWMRKRELALRVVNGAKRFQLFWMLMLETGILIIISALISAGLGILFQDSAFACQPEEKIHMQLFCRLPYYCASVCLLLIAVCCAIIYIAAMRICRSSSGLSAQMRRGNSHIFRNIMLSVQIFISMGLMCAAASVMYLAYNSGSDYHIPEDASMHHDAVEIHNLRDEAIYSEIAKLPETRHIFKDCIRFHDKAEIGLDTAGGENNFFQLHCLPDAMAADFMACNVSFISGQALDSSSCILSQDLYDRCLREGVIKDGIIRLGYICAYDPQLNDISRNEAIYKKVAGTFEGLAFDYYDSDHAIVIGEPEGDLGYGSHWVAIAHPGQKQHLMEGIDACIHKVDPAATDNFAEGFTDHVDKQQALATSLFIGILIFCITSFVLCISGVYSTAALDTRARRKEMAIRKINGAKARNIAMIFVKTYIWILIPSTILSAEASAVFIEHLDNEAPVALPILIGIGIATAGIVLTIAYHVRNIMRVNPSDIIAKE